MLLFHMSNNSLNKGYEFWIIVESFHWKRAIIRSFPTPLPDLRGSVWWRSWHAPWRLRSCWSTPSCVPQRLNPFLFASPHWSAPATSPRTAVHTRGTGAGSAHSTRRRRRLAWRKWYCWVRRSSVHPFRVSLESISAVGGDAEYMPPSLVPNINASWPLWYSDQRTVVRPGILLKRDS